jgi:putative copper resistance protein D
VGAAALIGARFLQFSGALTLFGAALYCLYGLDRRDQRHETAAPWIEGVLIVSAITALAGSLFWIMAETAQFSDRGADAFNPVAVWTVLWETRFGRACLLRMLLLVPCLALLLVCCHSRPLAALQSLLGAAVLATFVWTGHGAMDRGGAGIVHIAADLLHLLAAGAWSGALIALCIQVWHATRTKAGHHARGLLLGLERFSAVGSWVVATIIVSGIINTWFLVGWEHRQALWRMPYGIALTIKLLLFAAMLALAANHRYRSAPALRRELQSPPDAPPSLPLLRASIVLETLLGALVLLAVSVIGTLEPPAA